MLQGFLKWEHVKNPEDEGEGVSSGSSLSKRCHDQNENAEPKEGSPSLPHRTQYTGTWSVAVPSALVKNCVW